MLLDRKKPTKLKEGRCAEQKLQFKSVFNTESALIEFDSGALNVLTYVHTCPRTTSETGTSFRFKSEVLSELYTKQKLSN